MNKVLDVSRYVINYSNDKLYGISNLKLQKILYFIQAYFLISEPQEPCFDEVIEAWDFGPVVPIAYQEFKQYGGGDIPYINTYLVRRSINVWDFDRKVFDDSVISKRDKILMQDVVDKFADYSATDLVSLTHSQAPWLNAYRPNMNNEITTDAIKEYFNGK